MLPAPSALAAASRGPAALPATPNRPEVGRRLFRRPVAEDEMTGYATLETGSWDLRSENIDITFTEFGATTSWGLRMRG